MRKLIPLVLLLLALIGCSAKQNEIEMELSKDYSTADPFVNASLFTAAKSTDKLPLEITFQMDGAECSVEIADNKTKEVFWHETWHGKVDETKLTVNLDHVNEEIEYVVRMIGSEINEAKVILSGQIIERERPIK